MFDSLVQATPLSVILLLLTGTLLASARIGNALGQRAREKSNERARSQVTTAQAAVFGLLALLLAFTFSMAAGRFDTRKQLVLQEANAIGTAFLRADLLSADARAQSQALLRRYIDVRLDFYEAGTDVPKVEKSLRTTEDLQSALWAIAVTESQRDLRSVPVGLYTSSLNEVIDLHAKRTIALIDHVPNTILWILFAVASLSMLAMGYGNGLDGQKYRFSSTTTAVLIALVILLIVDLDRPRRGLIEVSQKSMIDLKQTLARSDRH